MILVTVGTQVPFDRMMRVVEAWQHVNPHIEVVAQVGRGGYMPSAFTCSEFLDKRELDALMQRAELVVSHAGMGSILTALSCGTPIVVMPRDASRGEHRNDHQLATARALNGRAGLTVVFDEQGLLDCLDGARPGKTGEAVSAFAPDDFIIQLRAIL